MWREYPGGLDGQLLAPLQNQINLTSAILTEKLNSVSTLLTIEIDPARETSVVGHFLNSLRQLLDAKRSIINRYLLGEGTG